MIKIAVFLAVVAIAHAGVLVQSPASTTLLASPVAVAAPIAVAAPAVAAVRTVAVAPQIAAVRTIAAPATVIAAAPQIIQTGNKVVTVVEPVEQHGYRIQY